MMLVATGARQPPPPHTPTRRSNFPSLMAPTASEVAPNPWSYTRRPLRSKPSTSSTPLPQRRRRHDESRHERPRHDGDCKMTTMEAPRTSRPAMPSARGITVRIDEIEIPATARPYNASAVVELSNSIAAIGLQSAPTLVERDGKYRLVAGRHRLEAMKILRHESVFARVVDFDDIAARLWTLSENLHRNELSALERSEAIAEYAQLWENRRRSSEYEHKGVQIAHPEAQPVQVAHPERRYEQ